MIALGAIWNSRAIPGQGGGEDRQLTAHSSDPGGCVEWASCRCCSPNWTFISWVDATPNTDHWVWQLPGAGVTVVTPGGGGAEAMRVPP